ncbi:MAG: hydrolase 76 protein [Caeruleum heppii]|nr:MAG: hydrolase 76 protein [Caeruleum heppii]
MRVSLSASARQPSQSWTAVLGGALLLSGNLANALQLNLNDVESIKSAARTAADGMMKYYDGNKTGGTPGNLPEPYYWWECGAMFGAMVDYWFYTGDTTYNEVTTQALLAQVGPDNDYMPPNQTKTEGNDDQAFWAMAVMSAAENKFPDPPADQPQWLALVQAVFNLQAARWDDATCNGGLRWQIYSFNNGYNYKNTISNGCFFNMAARLARYTGNQTYTDWANKMWDWSVQVNLISEDYRFFDGTDVLINCSNVNRIQWTYNAGVYLHGAANMYNLTNGDPVWEQRTKSILEATSVFFSPEVPNVMYEVACEPFGKCNVDQRSFKAYLSRWMAATAQVAPFTYDFIMPKLRASADAAAKQCIGGDDGNTCGIKWTTNGVWDGSFGVGEQMTALSVIGANLITKVPAPVTEKEGTSKGDPTGGSSGDKLPEGFATGKVTSGDRAGAGFLTTLILLGVIGGAWWLVA